MDKEKLLKKIDGMREAYLDDAKDEALESISLIPEDEKLKQSALRNQAKAVAVMRVHHMIKSNTFD